MQEKENRIIEYLHTAEEQMSAKNYALARKFFLKAGEQALIMAGEAVGKERVKYLRYYEECISLANDVQAKNNKAVQSLPENAQARLKLDDIKENEDGVKTLTEKQAPEQDIGSKPKTVNISDPSKAHQPHAPVNRKLNALSPQWLSEYVGQPDAVNCVSTLINAAKLKDTVIPHLIIYGSHGLGKTTFARIIANEMGIRLKEINVSGINMASMLAMLKSLKPKDIVFIDEIHTLPKEIAESLLYSALQDHRITYTEGKGKFAKTETLELPPFTLIGATTELGELAAPFTQRAILIRFKEYNNIILSQIIAKSFYRSGMSISPDDALSIAKRCRNNPRVANNMVNMISSNALVQYAEKNGIRLQGQFNSTDQIRKCNIRITADIIDDYFKSSRIDEYGLEEGDRQLLSIIVKRYGGGPVSIDTLARAMNESNNVLKSKYESYLIKRGMIKIESQGRVAMPRAYEVLGLEPPSRKVSDKHGDHVQKPKRDAGKNSFAKSNTEQNSPDDIHANENEQDFKSEASDKYIGEAIANSDVDSLGSTELTEENVEYSDREEYDIETEERQAINNSRWEKRNVIASQVPDTERCTQIEALITYPDNVGTFTQTDLDELFPDIEKEYDETTQHRCLLEIDIAGKKRQLECDSFLESRFASLMSKIGFLSDIKAQTVELEYVSSRLANHKYYPDFVIKDYKGRIAVIEMKNYLTAAYHLNIDKYDELKKYCLLHGYGYAEIMKPNDSKGYISLEMLKNAPINKRLEQFIIERLDYNGKETPGQSYFTKEDFYDYKKQYADGSEQEIFTILLNNRDLRNEDRNGNNLAITRS